MMKTIGLLGGTSWPSTFSYYEQLNRLAQQRLGGFHSARILLYSIDYHPIKSRYNTAWAEIPGLLLDEIQHFLHKQPDCLVLCNNTLHKALDIIRPQLPSALPVFHAGRLAAAAAKEQGCRKVLLLGTAFTMTDGFFARYFAEETIAVVTPSADDRAIIQAIQAELAQGVMKPDFAVSFSGLLERYAEVDAIILACTELPLVITAENAPRPLINPIACQCQAAADFAFAAA